MHRAIFLLLVFLPACHAVEPLAAPRTAAPEVAEEGERLAREMTVQYLDRFVRVQRIADRLRRASTGLCEVQVASFGIATLSRADLPGALGGVAPQLLDLWEGALVVDVREGSPAARAGIVHGDRLVSVDGGRVRSLIEAESIPYQQASPVTMRLDRAGETFTRSVEAEPACPLPVLVTLSGRLSAHTDGRRAVVTSAIVRMLDEDDGLALVVAHELAHALLGHPNRPGRPGSGDSELAADYLGLYLAARAGFDVEAAPELWRRLAVEAEPGWRIDQMPTRIAGMRAAIAEISDLRARQLPLRPPGWSRGR